MPVCILVVDDEERIRSLLKAYMTQEGYRVVTAPNGKEALLVVRREHPDLILLDIMMPEMNGIEFMRALAKEREVPIILLTAKLEEDDKIIGLEMGADDYVTKPFSPRELAARVRTVLRRFRKTDPVSDDLTAGCITINHQAHLTTVKGIPVSLTRSEFEILALLMSAPGRAFTRPQLLDHLQGISFDGIERTIDVHIKNLRNKIAVDPDCPAFIETVYGVGYRFIVQEEQHS